MRVEADELLDRAARLAPVFRERAAETERQRQVPAQSIREMTEAGLYRISQPARFGGYEYDWSLLVRVIAEISRGCGSTGWVYGLSAGSQWLIGLFPPQAQEDVWGDNPDSNIEGAVAPSAIAQPVAGGFRLSGTWTFGSGCDHADWMYFGALIASSEGARPTPAFLLVPRSDFRIVDTWHAVGLCGTGSKDVVIEDAFVPAHRVVAFADLSSGNPPGAAIHANPLYRVPFLALIPLCIATPACGIAQDALDAFEEMAGGRKTKGAMAGAGNRMAEFPTVQLRVAEAAGLIDAARLLLLCDAAEPVQRLQAGGAVDVGMRIRNRRNHALAVKFCVEAVNGLYAATGASGLLTGSRLQRNWRDVNAIAKHISVNWDAVGTLYGQHVFGLEPRGQY
jgi:alkylation response protein AidB-like acyl-CoA dehydrogenase